MFLLRISSIISKKCDMKNICERNLCFMWPNSRQLTPLGSLKLLHQRLTTRDLESCQPDRQMSWKEKTQRQTGTVKAWRFILVSLDSVRRVWTEHIAQSKPSTKRSRVPTHTPHLPYLCSIPIVVFISNCRTSVRGGHFPAEQVTWVCDNRGNLSDSARGSTVKLNQ